MSSSRINTPDGEEIDDIVADFSPGLEMGSDLRRRLASLSERHGGLTGFHIMEHGREALIARAALADAAQKNIDAQYYIYDADEAGSFLALRLIAAADRGVHVRLLLDDHNLSDDREVAALCGHPNIEARIFNPLRFRMRWTRWLQYVFDYQRAVRRMHNKVFTVDNAVSILGGRNVGNSYFEFKTKSAFRDFDLLLAGPLVAKTASAFNDYWNSQWAVPASRIAPQNATRTHFNQMKQRLRKRANNISKFEEEYASIHPQYLKYLTTDPQALIWANGELVAEPPRKIQAGAAGAFKLAKRLDDELRRAQKDVLIECAYFVPGREGVRAMRALRKKGVSLKVLTCGLEATDVPLVYAGYRKYRRSLLKAGVEIFEYKVHLVKNKSAHRWYRPRSSYAALHSKVFIFDRQRSWIGSFNIDPRSKRLNTEIAVMVDSRELADKLAGYVMDDCQPERSWQVRLDGRSVKWMGVVDGASITVKHEPAKLMTRWKVGILSLIPWVEQLL